MAAEPDEIQARPRKAQLRGWDTDTEQFRDLLCDQRGILRVVIQPEDASPVVRDLSTTATEVQATAGMIANITGIPEGSTLILEEGGNTLASFNPTDTIDSPLVFAAGVTARLVGIAALATFPLTFWVLN